MLLYFLVPVAIIVVDQIVKYWASSHLATVGSIPLIEGVFHLTYAENRGAAFSILQGQRWFFIVITVVMVGVMIFLLYKKYITHNTGKIAVLFVIGGALGNFIDRIRLGYVVDMFDFCLIDFPIFNVADVFLTMGGVLLAVYILFFYKEAGGKKENEGN